MAFIQTGIPQAGIIELLFYKGSTGAALSKLAHTILHGRSPLTKAERELIASYVSYLNQCEFCHFAHSASANEHLRDPEGNTVTCIQENIDAANVSEKMKVLLKIAGKVQQSGKAVTKELIDAAKKAGAREVEIHDAVLIAAAFCMYNRYVDGLNTALPESKAHYIDLGKRMAVKGYKYPPVLLRWLAKIILRRVSPKLRERPENNSF